MKSIIAVNASPRSGWNTDTLIRDAARGAESEGASVEVVDLYRLERFTGCVSCFGCKLQKTMGRCVCSDGLSETLEKIRRADGLILGSPIYLGDLSAGFRALYERLVFQYLTYCPENRSCNPRPVPVGLVVTSNCPEEAYDKVNYNRLLSDYRNTLEAFIGPAKLLISSDTLQVSDYSKYHWTMFDPEKKKKRREEVFPEERKKAFALGAEIAKGF